MLKKTFLLLFSALLGAVLIGWFSPSLILYYFEPPVSLGLSCRPAVEWGIESYRKVLLIGGGLGMVLCITLMILRAVWQNKHPKPKTTT